MTHSRIGRTTEQNNRKYRNQPKYTVKVVKSLKKSVKKSKKKNELGIVGIVRYPLGGEKSRSNLHLLNQDKFQIDKWFKCKQIYEENMT